MNNFLKYICIFCIFTSILASNEANAYQRYTWSELVTGGNKSSSLDEDEKINIITDWWGLKRIVKSEIRITTIIKNSYQVLKNKSKYSNDQIFRSVMDLRYIYKYIFKDSKKSDEILSELDSIKDLKSKVELELFLSSMKENSIIDDSFYKKLISFKTEKKLFPYDNGYMPVITIDRVNIILSIKEMVDGKGTFNQPVAFLCWNNIPSQILYFIATNKQDRAYSFYKKVKQELNDNNAKLIEDFIFPMYYPVKTANRKFLAGLYAVEIFPSLGIDLILSSISSSSRVTKPDHALASLVDIYNRHNALNESKKVNELLNKYYPNSIWIEE